MIDIAAYALLKRGITTAGAITGATIVDARIEDGELILIMSDNSIINAGKLPTSGLTEEQVRVIAQEITEETLVDFVPQHIVGGGAQG